MRENARSPVSVLVGKSLSLHIPLLSLFDTLVGGVRDLEIGARCYAERRCVVKRVVKVFCGVFQLPIVPSPN